MTSEMGEDFNAWRAARSANREARMRHNLAKLSEAGVAYETPHALHHAVINAGCRTIDYWPTTDRWQVRGEAILRQGRWKLIEFVHGLKKPIDPYLQTR